MYPKDIVLEQEILGNQNGKCFWFISFVTTSRCHVRLKVKVAAAAQHGPAVPVLPSSSMVQYASWILKLNFSRFVFFCLQLADIRRPRQKEYQEMQPCPQFEKTFW